MNYPKIKARLDADKTAKPIMEIIAHSTKESIDDVCKKYGYDQMGNIKWNFQCASNLELRECK